MVPRAGLAGGLAPFVIFHGALVLILAAAVAPNRWSRRIVVLAFGVVTVGALGAVFHREVVAGYRWLVVAVAAVTAVAAAVVQGRALRSPSGR